MKHQTTLERPGSSWKWLAVKESSCALASRSCWRRPGGGTACSGGCWLACRSMRGGRRAAGHLRHPCCWGCGQGAVTSGGLLGHSWCASLACRRLRSCAGRCMIQQQTSAPCSSSGCKLQDPGGLRVLVDLHGWPGRKCTAQVGRPAARLLRCLRRRVCGAHLPGRSRQGGPGRPGLLRLPGAQPQPCRRQGCCGRVRQGRQAKSRLWVLDLSGLLCRTAGWVFGWGAGQARPGCAVPAAAPASSRWWSGSGAQPHSTNQSPAEPSAQPASAAMGAAYSGSTNKATATEILKREKADLTGAIALLRAGSFSGPCSHECRAHAGGHALCRQAGSGDWLLRGHRPGGGAHPGPGRRGGHRHGLHPAAR